MGIEPCATSITNRNKYDIFYYLFLVNGSGGVPQICQKDQIVLEEGD
jgi:hypothetical protein